jgi:hypothetical protein
VAEEFCSTLESLVSQQESNASYRSSDYGFAFVARKVVRGEGNDSNEQSEHSANSEYELRNGGRFH